MPTQQETNAGTNEHLYTFPKNEGERIHLTLRQYRGRYYVDLRVWFQENENAHYTPTKKGFSVSTIHLPKLSEGIRQLETAYTAMLNRAAETTTIPAPNRGIQKTNFPEKQTNRTPSVQAERHPAYWQKKTTSRAHYS